ncbi:response regulator transcription factor [Streptococcus didelphis]|uniref:Response regulator transcription factor n=1 Tax=Streptococcus didelphis TaxID=102886 RepID=A0ABY9LGF7_9STRE|nr:response regulator transcription factor [Streptococcus didelphis]WMB27948.1 response regulator transcription factor [Streptococcus didelphis]WMB29522.1 response regulator transcription factor [Streptococcus didelphis]WMB29585.1 response regulator transcription factor [Streptococcus didelphis]
MDLKLLLVDDELEIIDINKRYLEQAGYQVSIATNGLEALDYLKHSQFDMIITDIMMPQMDGYDFISEVLVLNPDQPFLFITAKISEPDKIYSLSLGADDFISKPFSPRELVLRVNNILRRIYGNNQPKDTLTIGDLTINSNTREVFIAANKIELTNKAFALLWTLASNQNRVFSKTELYEKIWGENYLEDANTLNVHIHSLRNDMAKYSSSKTPSIKTVWGLGYKLEE